MANRTMAAFSAVAALHAVALGARSEVGLILDPDVVGPRFDGVGAVSGGGGGSRLLVDYPEPQRSEIYDLLFKPGYGASLHTLKVEIGCDGDTTQGAEQTHMRSRTDNASTALWRNYEHTLLVEAQKRNPDMHLSGLEWGVPGWVADDDNVFTEANQDYIIAWLRGLRTERNININSVGLGFNERGFDANWTISMRKRLDREGFTSVQTIAADLCCGSEYKIAEAMAASPDLTNAVDIIGTHCPGYANGQSAPDRSMLALETPFWDTEQHLGVPDPSPDGCFDWGGFTSLAQVINRNYIDSYHTATLVWTLIYSWYDWLFYPGKGLIAANQPWSGYFNASDNTPIWAVAHTTQFSKPGWNYLGKRFDCTGVGSPCGLLGRRGAGDDGLVGKATPNLEGSYVALASPDGSDFSLIIETFNASETTYFTVELRGAWKQSVGSLYLWTSRHNATFRKQANVPAVGGFLNFSVPPDQLWTLTTLPGGSRAGGAALDAVPPPAPFPTPFKQDFDGLSDDSLVPFFCDMHGAFSAGTTARDGHETGVLVQRVTESPVATHTGRHLNMFSVSIGDATLSGYDVSVDARVDWGQQSDQSQPAPALFVGSHAGMANVNPSATFDTLSAGFVIVVNPTLPGVPRGNATWTLMSKGQSVASGGGREWAVGDWIRMSLNVQPNHDETAETANGGTGKLTATVDGKVLAEVDVSWGPSVSGAAYLGSGRHLAMFDNFSMG